MGFSRLFDTHKGTRTLVKIANCLEQDKDLSKKSEIKLLVKELRDIDTDARKDFDFRTPRDKYFAHLDKKKVFSSMSLFKEIKDIEDFMRLLDNIIDNLTNICKIACGDATFLSRCREITMCSWENMKP